MERRWSVLATAVAALVLVPTALAGHGHPGPFAGTLEDGETDTHHYDNNPPGGACIQVIVSYTVRLRYTPPSDTLTLRVDHTLGNETATGFSGQAAVSFDANWCTEFTVNVTGTEVASEAVYGVDVCRGPCPPTPPSV